MAKSRVSKALSVVLPGGALGASIVLALSSAQAAAAVSPNAQADAPPQGSVVERLKAIRAGVSELNAAAAVAAGSAASAC